MGGGNRIAYQWSLKSPYWRSTMELYNQASEQNQAPVGFVPSNFIRWDEQFGRIGMYGDDSCDNCCPIATASGTCEGSQVPCNDQYDPTNDQTGAIKPIAYVREMNHNLRNPNRDLDTDMWIRMPPANTCSATLGTNASYGMNQYYRDPEPIPQLWLQLQPQLAGITGGLGNAIAQVQFEVDIEIELMGQCPSVMEAFSLTGSGQPNTHSYARRWVNNMGWKMPIFYPITMSDDYTVEN